MSTLSSPAAAVHSIEIKGIRYGVEPIDPHGSGLAAYRLTKQSGKGEVYDVLRAGDGLTVCDCAHYTYRLAGNSSSPCKHGQGLIDAGLFFFPDHYEDECPELTESDYYSPDDDDLAWNAETSPANREGYSVPGESSPFDLELFTMDALAYWNECLDPTADMEDLEAQARYEMGLLF